VNALDFNALATRFGQPLPVSQLSAPASSSFASLFSKSSIDLPREDLLDSGTVL
jgi:hypothetical protein